MKKTLSAIAACAMFSVAGLAAAEEPMQLTENQMDNVSAGAISIANSGSFALLGTALSGSSSSTSSRLTATSLTLRTNADSFALADGLLVVAQSEAAAEL